MRQKQTTKIQIESKHKIPNKYSLKHRIKFMKCQKKQFQIPIPLSDSRMTTIVVKTRTIFKWSFHIKKIK